MKRLFCVLMVGMLTVVASAAEPKPGLPAELTPEGGFVVFLPDKDTSGVVNATYWPIGHDYRPFPVSKLGGDPRAFFRTFDGVPSGTYRYLATFTGDKGELVQQMFAVKVGEGDVIPPPIDEFVRALRTAYATDADPDGRLITGFRRVYTVGVTASATARTWGDLFAAMATEATAVGVAGKLPSTQAVIASMLKKNLPSDGAGPLEIDAAGRSKAKTAFESVTKALTEVRK